MKLLTIALSLLSLSAFAGTDMDKTCQFSVETADLTVYTKTLAKVRTGVANEKLQNGYRVNLNSSAKKSRVTVYYSDVNQPSENELHKLTVNRSGAVKKVITDVNGETVVLRLICAYDKD